ncbi:hypothetical protein C6W96_34540 [Streptomyces sp. CS149]|uniref:hypothetical protein n=1 Tax=Streptomyces sp. CS149 TaxID=2109332 RepID=UPI000D19D230|nr:hypothetical protein [Streptomyces sp. CS149]PSK68410.1 hypothetical protein C6W96_34540 [Streptomyces sp. CS149]
MSDEGVAEPDTQPLTDDWHSVLSTMVAMLSVEDDMKVVSCLNERLAPMEGSPEAEFGEGDDSGPAVPVSPAEDV